MHHARLLHVALVGIVACSCLSGCKPDPLPKDPFIAKCEKISTDGSQSLAAVEAIMGAKGTEVSKELFPKGGDPKAVPFTKGKLVKETDNKFKAVADENGTEAKVFRWERARSKGESPQAMFVVVLDDKVVDAAQVFYGNSSK